MSHAYCLSCSSANLHRQGKESQGAVLQNEAGENSSELRCMAVATWNLNISHLPLLWGFVPLQVPPATSDPVAFISFSARGATVDLAERRSVAIQNVDGAVFIQTDKPLYRAGQTGGLAVSLSSIPQDPEQNKIFQWLEVTSKHGIVQLSFPLIPEPILGSYHITVETKSGEKEYQSFRVEEYVLPKFEVTTTGPRTISFFDEEVRVKVCASYTYGQPVQGNARINVCKQRFYRPLCEQNRENTCEAVTGLRSVASLICKGTPERHFQWCGFSHYLTSKITVTNVDGEPVSNNTVLLELNGDYLANYTTDQNGAAAFSIDTTNFFDPSFKLTVRQAPDECADFVWGIDNEPKASFLVRRFYSRTNSFLKIEPVTEELSCGQQRKINVHYVLNREGYGKATHTNFYYLVSTFSITLTVTEKLAPSARLLLYTVHPHGEIVADSIRIHSEICFKNKVQLKFSEKQGLPGSKVGLHLEAAANSFCALKAIQSVLLRPGQDLSAENVSHNHSDLYGYYYNGISLEDDRRLECTPSKTIFSDGLYFEPVNVSRDGDVYRIFKVCGLCGRLFEWQGTVRKYFPETWIWELVSTDSSGEADMVYTIPDSITEWKASAFCVQDDAGFGISLPVSVTAFQPFFVDFTMPYSVIRGEKFNLIANVLNYLNKCVQVHQVPFYFLYGEVKFVITAEAKEDTSGAGDSPSAEEQTIYSDTLIQILPVELTTYIFHSSGDILGTALRNLDNLLHMPYGCGEQNMALFTPNIYALDYLNKTGQLSEEIRLRGTGYLSTGYQRQLSYKHRDGSYSSFGLRDGEGSVWLTAFVYKSLEQAKRYIYIDDSVQSQTLIWLASKQKSDGCFENAGSHFNNALKSGMNCLETAFDNEVHNLYNQALFAYVYGLAGKEERRQFFLEKLDRAAVRDGKSHWWLRDTFLSTRTSSIRTCILSPWLFDTVVALQALAQYGYLTFSKNSVNTVKVNFTESPSKIFQVNDKNRFLLQQASLPTIPGSYSMEVSGTGCNFSHFSFTGNRNVSNMAIVDVKMLSGYVPEDSSLKKVKNGTSVSQKEISFSFSVEQSLPVSDIKPVPVHIYDYYETGR
uniref:Ovostatin n=1 Tax=Malurus cyaneus samueli TaxID=2593467 RepID=A0A8C5TCX2_9PASS